MKRNSKKRLFQTVVLQHKTGSRHSQPLLHHYCSPLLVLNTLDTMTESRLVSGYGFVFQKVVTMRSTLTVLLVFVCGCTSGKTESNLPDPKQQSITHAKSTLRSLVFLSEVYRINAYAVVNSNGLIDPVYKIDDTFIKDLKSDVDDVTNDSHIPKLTKDDMSQLWNHCMKLKSLSENSPDDMLTYRLALETTSTARDITSEDAAKELYGSAIDPVVYKGKY